MIFSYILVFFAGLKCSYLYFPKGDKRIEVIVSMHPKDFYQLLKSKGIDFYAGVPDSLLKHYCSYLESEISPQNFHITPHEGSAAALGIGHYLATGSRGCIYLQNSGFSHILNPVLSLADPEIYGVPLLFLIGWRGEVSSQGEQIKDEPQHRKQGQVLLSQLESSDIPYAIISPEDPQEKIIENVQQILDKGKSQHRSTALVVRKNFFSPWKSSPEGEEAVLPLKREEAIEAGIKTMGSSPVLATTGMIGRELFEIRERQQLPHDTDFLSVGGMGHVSMIAAGVAAQKKEAVYCLDGDGSLLMHLGNLAWVGQSGVKNLKHILYNNGAHDSVGGQATLGHELPLTAIAKNCGYHWAGQVSSLQELKEGLEYLKEEKEGPLFLEVMVRKGSRKDLGRPYLGTNEMKERYMAFLKQQTTKRG